MKNQLILSLLASIIFLVGSASAQSVDEETSVIALFGDSISVGENITSWYDECGAVGRRNRLEGRPGLGRGNSDFCNPDRELQKILDESDRKALVVNHGIGGSQTFQGLSRIVADLNATKAAFPNAKDYYVLINYGTNDVFLAEPFTNQAFLAQKNLEVAINLRFMIILARQAGWIPVVSNLLPRTDHPFSVPGGTNDQIEAAVLAENAAFVDIFSNTPLSAPFFDNEVSVVEFFFGVSVNLFLHPSAVGYKTIAQRWFDQALESLIEPVKKPVIAPIMLLLDEETAVPPPP